MTGAVRHETDPTAGGEHLAVAVDMIRCDGHGICAWLFPERISLDRWGYPVVDPEPLPAARAARARRAVTACPRAALSVRAVTPA